MDSTGRSTWRGGQDARRDVAAARGQHRGAVLRYGVHEIILLMEMGALKPLVKLLTHTSAKPNPNPNPNPTPNPPNPNPNPNPTPTLSQP